MLSGGLETGHNPRRIRHTACPYRPAWIRAVRWANRSDAEELAALVSAPLLRRLNAPGIGVAWNAYAASPCIRRAAVDNIARDTEYGLAAYSSAIIRGKVETTPVFHTACPVVRSTQLGRIGRTGRADADVGPTVEKTRLLRRDNAGEVTVGTRYAASTGERPARFVGIRRAGSAGALEFAAQVHTNIVCFKQTGWEHRQVGHAASTHVDGVTVGCELVMYSVAVGVKRDYFASMSGGTFPNRERRGIPELDMAEDRVEAFASDGHDCPRGEIHVQHRREALVLRYVRADRWAAHPVNGLELAYLSVRPRRKE
jgi:hypothetical protein